MSVSDIDPSQNALDGFEAVLKQREAQVQQQVQQAGKNHSVEPPQRSRWDKIKGLWNDRFLVVDTQPDASNKQMKAVLNFRKLNWGEFFTAFFRRMLPSNYEKVTQFCSSHPSLKIGNCTQGAIDKYNQRQDEGMAKFFAAFMEGMNQQHAERAIRDAEKYENSYRSAASSSKSNPSEAIIHERSDACDYFFRKFLYKPQGEARPDAGKDEDLQKALVLFNCLPREKQFNLLDPMLHDNKIGHPRKEFGDLLLDVVKDMPITQGDKGSQMGGMVLIGMAYTIKSKGYHTVAEYLMGKLPQDERL